MKIDDKHIVRRLLDWSDGPNTSQLCEEAANEIERLRAERDALRALLDGFTGPCPSPVQWRMICDKAEEVRAALREGGK